MTKSFEFVRRLAATDIPLLSVIIAAIGVVLSVTVMTTVGLVLEQVRNLTVFAFAASVALGLVGLVALTRQPIGVE